MADAADEGEKKKLAIARRFLLASPPGEVGNVARGACVPAERRGNQEESESE